MIEELKNILGICYLINNGTEHDVFFSYAPHTDTIYIQVYYLGYDENNPQDLSMYFYMNKANSITLSSIYLAIENLLYCTDASNKEGALSKFENIDNIRIIK